MENKKIENLEIEGVVYVPENSVKQENVGDIKTVIATIACRGEAWKNKL